MSQTGAELIAAERQRQIEVEGYDAEHDAGHAVQLAAAAACYAVASAFPFDEVPPWWPWATEYWKPSPDDRVRELTRDRRLILAELKRELEDLRPEQWSVMTILGALAGVYWTGPGPTGAGLRIDTHVWRPSDLRDPLEHSLIYRLLK